MTTLTEWIWTTGALALGRSWIALVLLAVAAVAAGEIYTRLRTPSRLHVEPDHPAITRHPTD
jgi:hypothetical protein